MKKVIAALLTLTMTMGLAACGSTSGSETQAPASSAETTAATTETTAAAGAETAAPGGDAAEVVFWHSFSGALGEAMDQLVADYNAGRGAEKNVHVTSVFQGYEGTDKVILAYQTKDLENACDINVGLTSTIPSMLDMDWTVKISDMMAQGDSELKEEIFHPMLVRSVSYQNEMVALPAANSTLVMYYNVDALKEAGFDKAPATMDEMIEYINALTVKDGDTVTRYGLECQVKRYQLVNFLVSQSTDAFFTDMEGGRTGYPTVLSCDTDGTLKNFLTKWSEVIATGGYQPVENNAAEDFSTGLAAMTMMSSSKCGSVESLVGDSFEWMTAPIPAVNQGDTGSSAAGGSCYTLFDRGDEARLAGAWDFLQYLYSDSAQYAITSNSGYVPVTLSATDSADMKAFYEEHPQYLTAVEVIANGNPNSQEPMEVAYNEINSVITDIMLQFGQGTLDADGAYEEIVSQCNQLFDEWHEAND